MPCPASRDDPREVPDPRNTDFIMDNTPAAPGKGANWLKIFGILALAGALVAVGRIILRVFREEPADETEHHEAA